MVSQLQDHDTVSKVLVDVFVVGGEGQGARMTEAVLCIV